MIRIIWGHLHKMWLARNADRHGHGEEEKRNREWERSIREVRMWCKLKDEGRLGALSQQCRLALACAGYLEEIL